MTLSNMRYFVEVARLESITKAAEKLFISQPSLSKQIAHLEKEVGVTLFYRTHRTVHLTPAGRYLYKQFQKVLEVMDSSVEQARIIGQSSPCDLTIGILEGQEFTSGIMRRLRRFQKSHQGIEISLERCSFSKLRQNLTNGNFDLIITLSFDVEHLEGLKMQTIFSQRGAIAISKSNPHSEIENLSLDMLANDNFVSISAEESPNGYAMLIKQCCEYGFRPNIIRQHKTLENLLLSVEAGDGIAILDWNTRLSKSDAVRIVPLPKSDFSNVCAVYLKENTNPLLEHLALDLTVPLDGGSG